MLALIAGQGDLPAEVARAQGKTPLVCALKDHMPAGLNVDVVFRLEQLGTLIADLGARGINEVCLCGSITRPDIDTSAIDAATQPLVPKIMSALTSGDDAALRVVLDIFETAGFRVRAAHELAPNLLAPIGVLSQAEPDAQMRKDAVRGRAVLDALAPFDVGQACVVAAGQILGIETVWGTDHMLSQLPSGVAGRGAILVKRPKTGQDMRVDMPTVGPQTVRAIQSAGLAGLVIEAEQVLMLHRAQVLALADAAGIVIWARPAQ